MSITTYTELKASLANWLNRDDLTSVIPDFIALAEGDFDRKIRHWRMEARANATIDTRFTALPADFLENVRFHLDVDERPVELVTPLFLQKKRKDDIFVSHYTKNETRVTTLLGGHNIMQ